MRHDMLLAQGLMDLIPHQLFTVCVSSFVDKPAHKPRQTVLGIQFPSPARIMTAGPALLKVAEVKEREDNKNEEAPNTFREKTGEDEVRGGLDDSTVRREEMRLLKELQDMQSGRLGKTADAKHRIPLTPGAVSIYQGP